MEQITVGVETSNTGLLLSLLKNLRIVKWVEKRKNAEHSQLPPSKFRNKKDFWETFGSGKNTSVSIENIRKNAWRKNEL